MTVIANRRSVMTLFSRPTDVWSHRVRLVLAEKSLNIDLVDVDDGEARCGPAKPGLMGLHGHPVSAADDILQLDGAALVRSEELADDLRQGIGLERFFTRLGRKGRR